MYFFFHSKNSTSGTESFPVIRPKLTANSRRVTLKPEVNRLEENANDIFVSYKNGLWYILNILQKKTKVTTKPL